MGYVYEVDSSGWTKARLSGGSLPDGSQEAVGVRSLGGAIGRHLGVPGADNSGAEIPQRHVSQARNDELITQAPIQGGRCAA